MRGWSHVACAVEVASHKRTDDSACSTAASLVQYISGSFMLVFVRPRAVVMRQRPISSKGGRGAEAIVLNHLSITVMMPVPHLAYAYRV